LRCEEGNGYAATLRKLCDAESEDSFDASQLAKRRMSPQLLLAARVSAGTCMRMGFCG
jgi:hypothetical protein